MLKKIVIGLSVIVGLAVCVGGYFYFQNFVKGNTDTKGVETYIFIPKNATAEIVVDLLNEKGVVKNSSSLLRLMGIKKFGGRNIVPGKYQIKDGLTNNNLINHLRAGNGRLDSKIVFNQLRSLKSISAELSREIFLDSTEVYNWLSNPDSIGKYGFDKYTIYSFFIPNTYFVDIDISMKELMDKLNKEYKKFWTEKRLNKAKEVGLTPVQAVTLASIVYWETKMPSDIPIVAGVYMNRIKVGMPLQADPTLIFALGDFTIKRVLSGDKQVDSPYNTYKNTGLPPGPILTPPAEFVDAVLNYQKHDYFYFVAKEDLSGYSYFAKTYEEHRVYAKRYQKRLNEMNVHR